MISKSSLVPKMTALKTDKFLKGCCAVVGAVCGVSISGVATPLNPEGRLAIAMSNYPGVRGNKLEKSRARFFARRFNQKYRPEATKSSRSIGNHLFGVLVLPGRAKEGVCDG